MPKKEFRIPEEKFGLFSRWLLLYVICLSCEENQRIYDRLGVSLKRTDNRGEAAYSSPKEYHKAIIDAEQGFITSKFARKQIEYLLQEVFNASPAP